MLHPTIEELTKGNFNRYELALATAKCARIITDDYVKQREAAEKDIAGGKDSDKPLKDRIDTDLRDEKAVKNAISRIYRGEFLLVRSEEIKEASEESETVEAPAEAAADLADAEAAE